MAAGKVKWFNNAKGYGFILPEGGGEDLFAHYSAIQMEGYKTLKAGQWVEFEVEEGPKGYLAVNINPDPGGSAAAPDTAPAAAGEPAPQATGPSQEAGSEDAAAPPRQRSTLYEPSS